jgi:potassium efflux system protein
LQDLGNSQHDLLVEKVRRLDQEIQDLQTLINQKRLAHSQETVTQQSIEAQKAGGSSLLATESATNLKLSDYLLKSTDRLNELTQQNLKTKQQLDTLTQSDQALDEQINVLKGSLLLSKILYKQKQALPRLKVDRGLADEIADIRLYQFEVSQQREQISNPATTSTPCWRPNRRNRSPRNCARACWIWQYPRRPAGAPEPRTERAAQRIDHPATQPETAAEHRAKPAPTLDEQMFWIPSNKPLDVEWMRGVPERLKRQIDHPAVGFQRQRADRRPDPAPAIVPAPAAADRRAVVEAQKSVRKLNKVHQDIGHFKRDRQWHTPLAILINILLAMPVAWGWRCAAGPADRCPGTERQLGAALLQMGQAWLVFYTAYRILAPGGVAELHFRWEKPQVEFLRAGSVDWARGSGLVAVVAVAELQPSALADDVLGMPWC